MPKILGELELYNGGVE